MPKLCNYEKCKYPCFGGGFCKSHQWYRSKVNKTPGPVTTTKKSYPKKIKSVSKKQASKNRQKGKITKKDHLMYQEIWDERDHIDFETGQPIFGEALTLYFHHVLPKKPGPGGYPQFRHKKWNIVIISWETHSKAESNIDLVPKIKAYRDELLTTYVN